MKEITLNGYIITIEPDILRIYDPFDDLTKEEAHTLVGYCYDEGFLVDDFIECEIVKGSDDLV